MKLATLTVVIAAVTASLAGAADFSLYQVGNSFTWDSQPTAIADFANNAGYDWSYGYHIKPGSSAQTIVANPLSGNTVNPPGRFEAALPGDNWDAVVIQSHRSQNATLGGETTAIDYLADLTRSNPGNQGTDLWLYQSWSWRSQWDEWELPVGLDDTSPMQHRRAYFVALQDRLATEGHEFNVVPIGDVLFRVIEEALSGNLPQLGSTEAEVLSSLYRDGFHLSYTFGRFLATTTVLSTVTQQDLTGTPASSHYGSLDPGLRDTLQTLVWDVVQHHPQAGIAQTLLDGDYNGDGLVDVADWSVWKADYGSTTRLSADGNHDGLVDGADYAAWRNATGSSSQQMAKVPELPTCYGLVLFTFAAARMFRPRLLGNL